jgi:hypothetical protein
VDPTPWRQVKGSWKFPWYAEVLCLHRNGKTEEAAKELLSVLSIAAYMDQCPIFENKSVTRPIYRDCARLALLMLPALSDESIQALSAGLKQGLNGLTGFGAALKNHFLYMEHTQAKRGIGPIAKAEEMLFQAEAIVAVEKTKSQYAAELAKAAKRARKFLEAMGRHPLHPTRPIRYLERYEKIEGLMRTVLKAMEKEAERREEKGVTNFESPDGKQVEVDDKRGCITS